MREEEVAPACLDPGLLVLYGLFRKNYMSLSQKKKNELIPAIISGPNFLVTFPVSQTFHKELLGTNC